MSTLPPAATRNTITQEAFAVSQQLLGLPLARPMRRLGAILLDLAIVSFLVNVGGGFLFGLAAAYAFFRFAAKAKGRGNSPISRTARIAFRVFGALILFIMMMNLWRRGGEMIHGALNGGGDGGDEKAVATASVAAGEGQPKQVSVVGAIRFASDFAALAQAETPEEARPVAVRVIAGMRRMGSSDAEIRQALESAARTAAEGEDGEEGKAWMPALVAEVLAEQLRPDPNAPKPVPPESLAVVYAAAVSAGDTAAADSLRPKLASLLARDSLDELRGELKEAESGREEAREELKRRENMGIVRSIRHFLDDLGIGFGWTALYFTFFTALWKGQTPGKRLLGIRVVRLNGQPMTLWAAFERFGGYAAGLFTGLLGYAQVFWDRNRQGIHDKITETVVIRVQKGAPLPPPPPPPYGQRPGAPFRHPSGAYTFPSGGQSG